MEQIPKRTQKTKPNQTTRQMQNKLHKHTPLLSILPDGEFQLWTSSVQRKPSYTTSLQRWVAWGRWKGDRAGRGALASGLFRAAHRTLPRPCARLCCLKSHCCGHALCQALWHFILRWLSWEGCNSCSLWRAETWAAGLAQELLHQLFPLQSNLSCAPGQ